MIAALVLAVLLTLDVCDACRVEAGVVHLCAPHASSEKKALTACGKGLRAKGEPQRVAALEALAAETEKHVNAPTTKVVELLARGTTDESFVVRTRAVELLGPPQHGPAALEALLVTLRELDQEMKRWLKEREKLDLELGSESQMKAQMERFLSSNESHAVLRAWGDAIVAQLARFPDDAAVDGIVGSSWGLASPGAGRALLALGSAPAVRGAVLKLTGMQEGFARRTGSRDAAKEAQELRALHDELAAFAASRSLPAPAWSAAPADAWKSWLAEHESAFAEHLPGVRSPAW